MSDFRIDGRSEIQEIKIIGDWAWCWTNLSIVVTPLAGGAPIKRAGNTLSIFQKRAGKWLLYRDANLLAVVKD
jgi:hypothetical protein